MVENQNISPYPLYYLSPVKMFNNEEVKAALQVEVKKILISNVEYFTMKHYIMVSWKTF